MVDDEDQYLWLEDVTSARALAWVRQNNASAVADLSRGGLFDRLRREIHEVLDAEERVPLPTWRGAHLYDFRQDAAHPRGVWRRMTVEAFRAGESTWDTLLDVDATAAAEGESWVWKGARVLRPGHTRALVSLSRGGADAVVVREFDLCSLSFVADGFTLAEAKSEVSWIDQDEIFVATDFGAGSLTESGYPRIVKRWRRGTPLAGAPTVLAAPVTDVFAYAWRSHQDGFVRDFARRMPDFHTRETFLLTDDGPVRMDVPADAYFEAHREWLLIRTSTPWTAGGTTHPAGTLLAARFDAYLAGEREMTVVFAPDERTSLLDWRWTRDRLVLGLLTDVRGRLEIRTPGTWSAEPIAEADAYATVGIVTAEPDECDDFLMTSEGFLRPTTLSYVTGAGEPSVLRTAPDFFDAAGAEVRQYFATSDDGTRIPYFVVGSSARPGPTLLYAYGGFEAARTPEYSGVIGRGWLARGGTYVLANIRGGGEYGPGWHRAALRENRPRAYEDFAAVARDLVARGITTPRRLGIHGRSNGGLLMGVMLTRYPELFGAVAIGVPLLDMRRYHRLLAGASWMAEYGDPDVPEDWDFLRGYSPYHNVRARAGYPPVLLYTSTKDDRVHPGHARKMAALLRRHGYDVTYYENTEGGHAGAAGHEQEAYLEALRLTFLWHRLR
ncbi:prolyl oligopeptidase family serine peptidase [Hamadaea tsunoensis]|uniref:prolyl oligopeptidase family serine peptidase n=1 Tax=Hamadaea tsunoensis TaxID=53368 RepID=UPI0003FFA25C|nr:prolyl oligopeptidase family serine peptidase [Hamadaea tsunoensis]